MGKKKPKSAGEAFLERLSKSPASKAALARSSEQLRAFKPPVVDFDSMGKLRAAYLDGARLAPPQNVAPKLDALADDSIMNHNDIATKLGIEAEPLRKRLERWRKNNGDGWQELTDTRPNESKYVYRIGSIRQLLLDAIASA